MVKKKCDQSAKTKRTRLKRLNETEEQREERLFSLKIRALERRISKSMLRENTIRACRKTQRPKKTSFIAKESEENARIISERERITKALRRQIKADERLLIKREVAREKQAARIARETEEQRQKRLERDRIRAALRRQNESEEQRQLRLYKDKIRKALKRREKSESSVSVCDEDETELLDFSAAEFVCVVEDTS